MRVAMFTAMFMRMGMSNRLFLAWYGQVVEERDGHIGYVSNSELGLKR
jgi:hypothetical protein